ncbi:DNA adenine methylase [Pantoea agglomerans]|uniref:DNA adenine methylase n=1 Tax=Enterobacter agglomerans TaxID=549 RepID=UPI002A6B66FA|nr:DNA adenine methylase [Pantoea agglomerans]MDY0999056.1 DNA adenine methylase [Pantoea agglomerans]
MSTILKWAGNKSRVMPELLAHLSAGNRLVEPFAGSCAVMMSTDYPSYLVADINPDLINLYRQIKEHTRPFIVVAASLFNQNTTGESYYSVRETFNHNPALPLLERAAHFLYLNRHGYRGMCRYNRSGEFNIPFGHYKKPFFPLAEIEAFAEKAQRATFICADFRETLPLVKAGDVVYCDPPYDGTFSDYHTAGFGKDEHHDLVSMLLGVSERCPVVVSNSDTFYTRSILRAFDITKISVARSVGVAAGEGKRASEIIAVRRPEFVPVVTGFDLAAGADHSVIMEVQP